MLAQTVKTSVFGVEVEFMVTRFEPTEQLLTMVMPVEVTFWNVVEATFGNAPVFGSKIYWIVCPAVVDVGLLNGVIRSNARA